MAAELIICNGQGFESCMHLTYAAHSIYSSRRCGPQSARLFRTILNYRNPESMEYLSIDVDSVPYEIEFVHYLTTWSTTQRPVWLSTPSPPGKKQKPLVALVLIGDARRSLAKYSKLLTCLSAVISELQLSLHSTMIESCLWSKISS
jgi:hypothetical protein